MTGNIGGSPVSSTSVYKQFTKEFYASEVIRIIETKGLPDIKPILEEAQKMNLNLQEILTDVYEKLKSEPVTGKRQRLAAMRNLKNEGDILKGLESAIDEYGSRTELVFEKAILKRDPRALDRAMKLASFAGVAPKDLLGKILSNFEKSDEKKVYLTFVKKVLAHLGSLEAMKKEGIHHLNAAKMLQISAVGEMKLEEGYKGYLKKNEVETAYSMLIDPSEKVFTILLKGKEGYGPIKAAGGWGKVTSAIEIAQKILPNIEVLSDATHVVQKVNKDKVSRMTNEEIEFEKKYGGLKSVSNYIKTKNGLQIEKSTFIKEAFECNLRQLRDKAPKLTLKEQIDVLDKLAQSVERMHHDGILHNDLKLENALWKPGKCVVSDFGLSFNLDAMPSPSAFQGTYGTPEYTAPEMVEDPDYEPGTEQDDYAFGILAYNLLTETETPWDEHLTKGFRKGKDDELQIALELQKDIIEDIEELESKQQSGGITENEDILLAVIHLLHPEPKYRWTLFEFRNELQMINKKYFQK